MMHAFTAAIACACAQSAFAATLIDFETVSGLLDDQHRNIVAPGFGVDFNGTVETLFSATARSGDHVARAFDDGSSSKGATAMRIDAVGAEFLSVAGFWTADKPQTSITLEAYSMSDALLASLVIAFKPSGELHGLSTADTGGATFAYLLVRPSGNVFLDDFEFELASSPVIIPLPSGAALTLAGCMVAASRRRRWT